MIAYTCWEQGRSLDTGQIISMTPINPSSTASSLGGITLGQGALALSALAQFGIWMEMRKMSKLREAEFEERRHAWLVDITNQWIDEHSQTHGILRDVTDAVAKECKKMWSKVCENKKVDVPQALLLRLKRLSEFIERNYAIVALGNNQLVEASESDEGWLLAPDASSKDIAMQILSDGTREQQGSWWKGLLESLTESPLFLIPGMGPLAVGNALGYGIGKVIGRAQYPGANWENLHDKIPLIQFGIAVSLLERASQQVHYLLNEQKFRKPTRFLAIETAPNQVDFLLDRVTPTKTRRTPQLKSIPLPT